MRVSYAVCDVDIVIEDAVFVHFIKPTIPIPQFITALTSITNNDVQNAETFVEVGAAFLRFMQQHADESNYPVDHIILVGHNGKVFDIPFLFNQFRIHKLDELFFGDTRFGFGLDTMRIARESVKKRASSLGVPSAYNLRTLFQFVTGNVMENSHCALDDVKATVSVLRHEAFWGDRQGELFQIAQGATAASAVAGAGGVAAVPPSIDADAEDDSTNDGSVALSSSSSS